MKRVLIYDWAGAVKVAQYGYEHNKIVEADLHTLIDFFLEKEVKVMVSAADGEADHDYALFVDDRLFGQR